jgi:hypothetical protein
LIVAGNDFGVYLEKTRKLISVERQRLEQQVFREGKH